MLPFRMFLIRMFPVRVFPDRMFRFRIMHKNDMMVNILKVVTVQYLHSCEPQAH
jgi:hypothetical protein